MTLVNNRVRILLDRILQRIEGRLSITACDQVQINGGSFVGGSTLGGNGGPAAIEITGSTVSINECVLQGKPSFGQLPFTTIGSPGLRATGSTLTICGGKFFGGPGLLVQYPDMP